MPFSPPSKSILFSRHDTDCTGTSVPLGRLASVDIYKQISWSVLSSNVHLAAQLLFPDPYQVTMAHRAKPQHNVKTDTGGQQQPLQKSSSSRDIPTRGYDKVGRPHS